MFRLLFPALIILPFITPAQAECAMTPEQFQAVKLGMSYAQVVETVGCDGKLLTESNLGGLITRMYLWPGRTPTGYALVWTQGGFIKFAPRCAPGRWVLPPSPPQDTSWGAWSRNPLPPAPHCEEWLPPLIVDTQKVTIKSQFGL